MKEWFTIEQLNSRTYVISEYQHWEETHCYLLLGEKEALLIDTGLGVADIRQVVSRLTSLPVHVALTHAHWDHIGGIEAFFNCMVHEKEQVWLEGKFPLPLAVVKQNLLKEPCVFPKDFAMDQYHIPQTKVTRVLHDGDLIDLGNRRLLVVHTPGHSPGHMCFYEVSHHTLYSGDLIYAGCLDAFYPTTDPLLFRTSLHKINALDIDLILPGHHALHINADIRFAIQKAFDEQCDAGELKQGKGILSYDGFEIHL